MAKDKSAPTNTGPLNSGAFPLGKKNFLLLGVGIIVIIIGFLLMQGGGSADPNEFNPEIFSFRRITLAPIVVLLGFAINIVAIMKKFND
ncbi:MAG: DUF3098 domain-containing protein [Flavobacteriales bacterium]|nr:DUF3098 domain-containing protein [Flavobacteriales bacterium]